MDSSNGKGRHSPPKTIRLAIAQRGHRLHNIWWVWSYKLRESCLLPSDAALFHFALLEADPRVVSYVLEAPSLATEMGGALVGTRFDAEVRLTDGTTTWDEVKWDIDSCNSERPLQLPAQAQLAAQHGVLYRLFTVEDLRPHTNRVWNCLRMLQVLQAAQPFSVASARTCVLARLSSSPAMIGELRGVDQQDEALNLAAVFGLMLEAAVTFDLDSGPITDGSEIRLVRS